MFSNKDWCRGRRRGWGVTCQCGWCLANGWASVCLWEVISDFFSIACLGVFPLHLLNCLYPNQWIFSLLFFLLFPTSCWVRGVSELLRGFLVAGWGSIQHTHYVNVALNLNSIYIFCIKSQNSLNTILCYSRESTVTCSTILHCSYHILFVE